MEMTKNQLADLVTEELVRMVENGELDEGFLDRLKHRAAGAGTKLKGAGAAMVQKGLGAAATVGSKVGGGEAAADMATRMGKAAAQTKKGAAERAGHKGVSSLLKGKLKKMNKLADDLSADMQKLGLSDNKRLTNAVKSMRASINAISSALEWSEKDASAK